MRAAALGVRLAILLLPRRIRGRYREEWHADLAGAPEAGLSAWNVALGALLFSITLDRRAPELSGLSVAVTARRRARWGIAFLLSAGVLWFGSVFLGGGSASLVMVAAALTILASGFAAVGLVQLWRAALAANTLALVTAALATAGAGCLVIGDPASGRGSLLLPLGLLLLFAAAVCGAIVAGSTLPPDAPKPAAVATPPRGIRGSLLAATTLLLAFLAIGAVELLVWGPLAQTESLSLDEVYAGLSEPDRTQGLVLIAIWIVFWSIAVVAFFAAIVAFRRSLLLRRRTVWSSALAIAAAMVFFQFLAGFSLGMSIADTLPPYRGGMSARGYAYALLGQLALVATIFLVIAPHRAQAASPSSEALVSR